VYGEGQFVMGVFMLRHLLVALAVAGTTLVAGPASAAAAPAPLSAAQLSHRMHAEVMGYLPYWELNETTVAGLDYHRLTTIAFFSVGMDAAGHLDRTGRGYQALMSDRASAVIDAAHAAGVRAIVSFTSFGSARNDAFFSDQAAQATFVDEAAALVASRGLDGADLDVERISLFSLDGYAATAGALSARLRVMNPIAYTTVATNANVIGALMAARALAAGVGRAFLMGYDYRAAGATTVGSVAPLVRAGGGLSLSASLDLYAAFGVPMDRVILGLPLYGRTWQTADQGLGAQQVAGTSGSVFLFRDLATLGAQGTTLAADTDTLESSARLVRAVDGAIYQTYYDSPATITPKLALVGARGLAGVGFWALGYDRDPSYWQLVGTTFGAPSTTAGATVRVVEDPARTPAKPR
jgi:spore germination protein YaaH